MDKIVQGIFYILVVFVPMGVCGAVACFMYRYCRPFRRKINRFFRTLPQWR